MRGASTSEGNFSILDFARYITISQDKNAHSSDKACVVCQAIFGRIGIAHAKRHHWQPSLSRFCFRGVCSKCSKQRVLHPDTLKPSKICAKCYNSALKAKAAESFGAKILQAQTACDSLRDKQRKLSLKSVIKDEVARLREEYQKATEEYKARQIEYQAQIEETVKKNAQLSAEHQNLQVLRRFQQQRLQEINDKEEDLYAELQNLECVLKEDEEDLVEMKSELERVNLQVQNISLRLEEEECSAQKISELQQQRQQLAEEVQKLERSIAKKTIHEVEPDPSLLAQRENLERDIEEQEQEINELNARLKKPRRKKEAVMESKACTCFVF